MKNNRYSNTQISKSNLIFIDNNEKKKVISFLMGIAVIVAAIFLGKSFIFYIPFLLFSVFITIIWRKAFRPWVNLASTTAATPISIAQQEFTCNTIFTIWYTIFNRQYFSKIPKWIKIASALALFGLFTSSINWMSGGVISSIMRQGCFFLNLFLGPFLLLPLVYVRMEGNQDHIANLQGLLFCLIIPSTLVLVSARALGTVANAWEASLHAQSHIAGYLNFQIGKVIVIFLRTEVGFIVATLTCASFAIAISNIRKIYKYLSGACFIANLVLFFLTASFGSGFSCFCGMSAIFLTHMKKINVGKALGSFICILFAILIAYNFLPSDIKTYLEKRYEHRVTEADADRVDLWKIALEQFFKKPEGVGRTLSVGDNVQTFIHNEYLVYAVSYGFFGGIAYVLITAKLLVYFLKMRKRRIDDPYSFAIYLTGLGVVVAITINNITDHLNANRWYFNVAWSIIWYCYFCSRRVQTETVKHGS